MLDYLGDQKDFMKAIKKVRAWEGATVTSIGYYKGEDMMIISCKMEKSA